MEKESYKAKGSYKIFEEVFDDFTLNTLYRMADKGYFEVLEGAIAKGKEASVYKAGRGDEHVAVKVYMTLTSEFKNMWRYIKGDPRFTNVGKAKHHLVEAWARKEFKNLAFCEKLGVRVPHPIAQVKNVLVMELIEKDGGAAPTAKDSPPDDPDRWYKMISGWVEKLYKNDFVHGDLSEFNVLNAGDPVIIDLAQGVKREHPMAEEMYRRDVANIRRWFSSMGVKVD